jgi:site-specific recombinase XerD
MNEEQPQYIDSMTRYKQERELKKAKKQVRKELIPKLGDRLAKNMVKKAANKVMKNADVQKKIEKHTARGV